MQERAVEIDTGEGSMNAYVFHPDRPGPFPTVLFYMDSLGLREELCDMARRIATVGYYVLLPNLYYRRVRCVDLDANRLHDPAYADNLALMWSLNRSLSNTMVETDTAAMLSFVDGEAAARGPQVATIGYCMAGRFVFRVAGTFADRVAASASFYGARLITDQPDSAHLTADRIKGEMYFGCAEHDDYISAADLAQIGRIIEKTGINARIEMYPGAEHGFAFPARRLFHKPSSERHWERIFDLLSRNL